MSIPRFRLDVRRRRRSSRVTAALIALAFVSSTVLGAMGVCIAKVPRAPLAAETSGEAPCPQHVAAAGTASLSTDPAAPSHCPQDDPGAQVRVGDLPAADVTVAPPFQRVATAAGDDDELCNPAAPDDFSYTPLYARLSRLLL